MREHVDLLEFALMNASDDAVKHGMFGMKYPRIPGHEIIGNVVAVGSGALFFIDP